MKYWTENVFHTDKPIIGMCHLMALPGDPEYDRSGGMERVIEMAKKDLVGLQEGGIDAVMFSNEFSMPYLLDVEPVTVASMARIIGELNDIIEVPFGVNVLWDPKASLDLAAATGASFVREIFSGVYASDFGLWNPSCGESVRHQHAVNAEDVKLLFNIVPESAQYLGNRDVVEIAKTTIFNHRPDAICISGITAGKETDSSLLKKVKDVARDIPVFANTGVNLENVGEQLEIADGAIVGTTFKYGGVFENHVDRERVETFMKKVKTIRK